jgi:hypothetical protein
MRPLPERMPDTHRRFVMRVPQQSYLRFDNHDYSLDPPAAQGRGGARQPAQAHRDRTGHGRACCSHPRSFQAPDLTDPAQQQLLDHLHGARRRGPDVELELGLIPA